MVQELCPEILTTLDHMIEGICDATHDVGSTVVQPADNAVALPMPPLAASQMLSNIVIISNPMLPVTADSVQEHSEDSVHHKLFGEATGQDDNCAIDSVQTTDHKVVKELYDKSTVEQQKLFDSANREPWPPPPSSGDGTGSKAGLGAVSLPSFAHHLGTKQLKPPPWPSQV
ncbi:hypothetical protein ACP70R_046797 [Stipagrostis hirtigluma subsp. patula]